MSAQHSLFRDTLFSTRILPNLVFGQKFSMPQVSFCFLAKTSLKFSSTKPWQIRGTVDLSWWVPEEGVNMRPATEEHMMCCLLLMRNLNLQFSYIKVISLSLFFLLVGLFFYLACSQAAEQKLPSSQVGWPFCQAGNFFHLQENLQKYKKLLKTSSLKYSVHRDST